MEAEQDRIQRKSVKSDAKKAYYADKDFFEAFTDAYTMEAVCQYFDMEDTLPSPHILQTQEDPNDRLRWANKHFTCAVTQLIRTFSPGHTVKARTLGTLEELSKMKYLMLYHTVDTSSKENNSTHTGMQFNELT